MNRKKFIAKILATGFLVSTTFSHKVSALTRIFSSSQNNSNYEGCVQSPREAKGPFPNRSPEKLVSADITGNRRGLPMTVELTIESEGNGCKPIAGAIVDIWHCDAEGNYSQYPHGAVTLPGSYLTKENFLRGRQIANAAGKVSFTSIFPGWYPGRAPHIHLEIFSSAGRSLLVTQIAFPQQVCNTIYTTEKSYAHRGTADTSNTQDILFRNSIKGNLADSVTGNIKNGYRVEKTIIV